MRFCFIVEERYRCDSMPLAVAQQLTEWGHEVDVFRPQADLAAVSELAFDGGRYDAWVLKTVSDGPGLSILEAVAASGVTTINDARSIRPVRDKAVAAAIARRHGLPFPFTYFAAGPALLREIPAERYPIVVKPANGSACRSVHLLRAPADLAAITPELAGETFLLAQPYLPNPGVDIKVYSTGSGIFATQQRSPLHPHVLGAGTLVPVPSGVEDLVRAVGEIFRLDLFGVDLLETAQGWTIIDINDFPSFSFIPDGVARVAETILRLAKPSTRSRRRRNGRSSRLAAVRTVDPKSLEAPVPLGEAASS
jgi:glutathione synthase/RimK-type ligase-like ATP-grasp enzyme